MNGRQWKIPLFPQACPIVTPCAFPWPSSNSHRRVQASLTNNSNTSPDCSYFIQASVEKINIYCYIYYMLFVWPERNVTLISICLYTSLCTPTIYLHRYLSFCTLFFFFKGVTTHNNRCFKQVSLTSQADSHPNPPG